jgi:hypothetical protein
LPVLLRARVPQRAIIAAAAFHFRERPVVAHQAAITTVAPAAAF